MSDSVALAPGAGRTMDRLIENRDRPLVVLLSRSGEPLGYYSTVSWPVASQGPSHRPWQWQRARAPPARERPGTLQATAAARGHWPLSEGTGRPHAKCPRRPNESGEGRVAAASGEGPSDSSLPCRLYYRTMARAQEALTVSKVGASGSPLTAVPTQEESWTCTRSSLSFITSTRPSISSFGNIVNSPSSAQLNQRSRACGQALMAR